jgi:dTDP-4-dehydrorhamnose reductase
MRLLITGGTGYLGTTLARRASDAGWAVGAPGSAELDVRDRAAVEDALAGFAPTLVVNAAYRQDTPDEWSINAGGAGTVASACGAAGVRLIHISTDVVFDGARRDYVEEDVPSPISDYGRSKAEGERLVAEAHPAALIVRTSLLYGGAIPSKHELAARDPSRTFFTDELRCPAQVDDLAAAVLELAGSDLGGLLHVAGPDAVSRCEFARLLAGSDVRCAKSTDLGIARPLDCTLDSSRASSLLRTRLRGAREVTAV